MEKNATFTSTIQQYKGDGPYLYINDKKFIDAASGTFNLALGYNNKRLINKLTEQMNRCCHLSSIYTKEISKFLLQKLVKHTPKGINRLWLRDITGSGAVECAIKIAQKYTGKGGVISLFLSHHGQSLATSQVSGNPFKIKNFYVSIDGSFKIPVPTSVMASEANDPSSYHISNIIDLEEYITLGSNERIACLIIEPILGNGGNIVLPVEFYKMVREICNKYKILIIADEIQTGFGRTGTFFATTGYAEHLKPDIITFSKGAGGIGIPVGGGFNERRTRYFRGL